MDTRRFAWGVMTYFALAFATGSLMYVLGDPRDFSPLFREKYIANLWLVRTHGVCGALMLASGPWQFLSWRRLHKVLGRAYLALNLVAGLSGWLLGTMALASPASFMLLATLWLYTAARALAAIRRGEVAEHRQWMTRNYALTFSAATLRLYLLALESHGFAFETVYPVVAWLSWIPNLLVAEWLLRGACVPGGRLLQPSRPAAGPPS